MINKKGIELIKGFEKCKLHAYELNDGKATIGWGNTYYENGTRVESGDQITQGEADDLLTFVLNKTAQGVAKLVKATINENQKDALVSFAYNAGLHSLEKSDLLRAVNSNPNDPKISGIFKNQNIMLGSKFERGLIARRLAEVSLYFMPI